MVPVIGVLALQGAFVAHQQSLADCGVDTRQVRVPEDLANLDGLVLPGGESTTMSNLLLRSGMFEAIAQSIDQGMATFGTCAGMILLAQEVVDGRVDQVSFGAMDLTVKRNAYGRQVDSFETDLDIKGLQSPFHAVFIRAPKLVRWGESVEVLAEFEGSPVLVRQNNCMAAAFHPELSGDSSVHQLFVEQVARGAAATNR